MSNDLQTNLEYFMMINYDSCLLCYFADIFFAMQAGSKEFNTNSFSPEFFLLNVC